MKSIKDIFDNYEAIGKALVIPVILLLVLNYLSTSFSAGDQKLSMVSIFFVFLSILVDMVILITVHRILILGNDSVPTWGLQKFEKREFKFFQNYLIVAIVFIVAVVLTTAFLKAVGLHLFTALFMSIVLYSVYLSRITLVFPAIAVDTKMTFRESYEYTKDFKLLIFVTVIVFPVIFSVVIGGVYTLLIKTIASSISTDLNILLVLLNVTISVFLVSALSNTYMYISETLANQNQNQYEDEDEDKDSSNDVE